MSQTSRAVALPLLLAVQQPHPSLWPVVVSAVAKKINFSFLNRFSSCNHFMIIINFINLFLLYYYYIIAHFLPILNLLFCFFLYIIFSVAIYIMSECYIHLQYYYEDILILCMGLFLVCLAMSDLGWSNLHVCASTIILICRNKLAILFFCASDHPSAIYVSHLHSSRGQPILQLGLGGSIHSVPNGQCIHDIV